jgi:hypothetical protein
VFARSPGELDVASQCQVVPVRDRWTTNRRQPLSSILSYSRDEISEFERLSCGVCIPRVAAGPHQPLASTSTQRKLLSIN